MRLHRLFDSLYRLLFGEDVFISYARDDSSDYARSLFVKLTDVKKGFTCFMDELGTEPGKEIPASLRRKVRSCAMLVLVGSPRSATSSAVGDEIVEFLTVRRNRERIVPIDIGGALRIADWRERIIGIDVETETNPDALENGHVSDHVIDRIERAAKYRKQNDRLRLARNGMLALLLSLLLLSGGAAAFAYQRIGAAKEANVRAQDAIARADTADRDARESRARADKATRDANIAVTAANKKIDKATELVTIAETRRTEAETKTKDAEAKRDQAEKDSKRQEAIAEARRLANESKRVMSENPEQIEDSVDFAVRSVRKTESQALRLFEPTQALRDSLAVLPQNADPPRAIAFENSVLSPDARYIAGPTDSAKLNEKVVQVFQADELKDWASSLVLEEGSVNRLPQSKHDFIFQEDGSLFVRNIAVSDNFRRVAVVKTDEREYLIEVKDSHDNTILNSRAVHSYDNQFVIGEIALSPDGKFLAVAGNNPDSGAEPDQRQESLAPRITYGVILWNLDTREFRRIYSNKDIALKSISFGEQGKSLIAAGRSTLEQVYPGDFSGNGYVMLWHFHSREIGEVIKQKNVMASPLYVSFAEPLKSAILSDDGKLLAVVSGILGSVSVWQLGDLGAKRNLARVPFLWGTERLRFSSDNKRLALLNDFSYSTWDVTGYTSALALRSWNDDLAKRFPDPFGDFAIQWQSGSLKITEKTTRESYQVTPQIQVPDAFFTDLTPDGKSLAVLGKDQNGTYEVQLYKREINGYANKAHIRVENPATYQTIRHSMSPLDPAGDRYRQIAISPKGDYVAVRCAVKTSKKFGVCIWNVARGGWLKRSVEHSSEFIRFKFSLDGNYFASSSRYRDFFLLKLSDSSVQERTLDYPIDDLLFDQPGKFLALVASDSIQVFNRADLSLATVLQLRRQIHEVLFSGDGKSLFTRSSESNGELLEVWDLDNKQLLSQACKRIQSNLLTAVVKSPCQ